MEFDFRNDEKDLSLEIDGLSSREMEKLGSALETIRQETREEKSKSCENWFESALLPVLKEYAEETSSLLEINSTDNLYMAFLENGTGFTIDDGSMMKYILVMASSVNVSSDGEKTSLSLTFDFNQIIR